MTEVTQEMEQKALQENIKRDAQISEILKKYDIEVITFSPEDQQKMAEKVQAVWNNFAGLNENTKKIVEFLREQK